MLPVLTPVARFAGLITCWVAWYPGADAPGFMLSPAPQADAHNFRDIDLKKPMGSGQFCDNDFLVFAIICSQRRAEL